MLKEAECEELDSNVCLNWHLALNSSLQGFQPGKLHFIVILNVIELHILLTVFAFTDNPQALGKQIDAFQQKKTSLMHKSKVRMKTMGTFIDSWIILFAVHKKIINLIVIIDLMGVLLYCDVRHYSPFLTLRLFYRLLDNWRSI